SDSAQNLIG
nr:sperm activating peptide III [Clypeaster japonicus]